MSALAKDFIAAAFEMLRHSDPQEAREVLKKHDSYEIRSFVSKASASVLGDLGNEGGAALAAAYVESIAEFSLLDLIIRHGRPIPAELHNALVGSGFTANVADEGSPKVVQHLNLAAEATDKLKAAAIVVLSAELANAGGGQALQMFEAELRRSVTRGTNLSLIETLTSSSANTQAVATTGNPYDDMKAAIKVAQASDNYALVAGHNAIMELSLNSSGLTTPVRGGQYIQPWLHFVAIEDMTEMLLIPMSRIAVKDHGLKVRSGNHASVDMADTPSSPSQQVSMFQTNSRALLAERSYELVLGDTETVVVS